MNLSAHFSLDNLPFGVFSVPGGEKQVGIAINDQIYNLTAAVVDGRHPEIDPKAVSTGRLNEFIGLGKSITNKVRSDLRKRLVNGEDLGEHLIPMAKASMHLPVDIGDYTDFYSSKSHATNVGKLYRDPENALMPNWKHLPVAYHGRSSSIVVSGTSIKRPHGQIKPKSADQPFFSPTQALDYEVELGFIIGKDSELGNPVSTAMAEDYIFGFVLVNDWSARDIQKWEYVPLGPFLGKNFATSISPWVVTYEALKPFMVDGPPQDPPTLDYLKFEEPCHIDLQLDTKINASKVGHVNAQSLYWNAKQQLAHHTVNGCNVRVGDLLASGTISGDDRGSYGSLLEISEGGKRTLVLDDGSERTFLQDGDEVRISGLSEKDGKTVGFGEVVGKIIK